MHIYRFCAVLRTLSATHAPAEPILGVSRETSTARIRRPRASRGRSRRLAPLLALLLALPLLAACTTDVSSPDGWAAPVQARDFTILQEKSGELAAVRLGATDNPGTPDVDERVAWRFPGDDDDVDLEAVYANPILDGNTLYVAGYSGEIVALDLTFEPPQVIWLRDLDEHIIATPAYDGQTLYVGTEAGTVVPITVASGAVGPPIAQAGERIWSEPLLDGGTLYVSALDKRVRAISPAGGEVWARPTELSGAVPGDAALEGGLLVVGSFDRRLHALDAETGAEEWVFDGDGWFWARPVIAGDTVYAASTWGSIYALNTGGGDASRVRWHFNQLDSEIRAAPVLAGGVLVVAAEEATIWGIDPATGDLRWSAPLPGHRFLADPLVLDSSLIYATTRGDLVEIDPQSGRAAILYERR
ncbi:MAG: PQQ-binding-like beta-propeller repeat protein [Chloroflexi bacterium]|nr:PQQ-binding-like beta-propeller repeat protein [Chloroflexota bacterium]